MFSNVVEMYRGLGLPEVQNRGFLFAGNVSPELVEKLRQIETFPPHFGNFEELSVDGNHVVAEFLLPSSEWGRFHSSVAQFIANTPSLNFGILPAEFYIQELDFYSRDVVVPPEISRLNDLCRFIDGLTALASGLDASVANRSAENRLLFVLAADGKAPAKTLSLSIKVSASDLQHPLTHVKILELLASNDVKNLIHVEERRSIMRLAVAEVLAVPIDQTQNFSYLVRQWQVVLEKYRHNVLAFVSQYAFEKVRKEIATAEIDHATKLSGVLGDIAGKLLALPVSFAAIVLLRKAGTIEEFWIVFIGLFTVSMIFGGVLWNQWLQVMRLRGSFDLIFGQYDEEAFPRKLRLPIVTAKNNISKQYCVLKGTFIAFGVLAAIPALGAIYVVLTRIPLSLADACILFS